jgi:glycosyltransferase involved in cell wall biosynthesis
MATGLPVVSTRVGGIPELLKDGQTGILVKRCDPKGLADGLIQLLSNEKVRQEMGKKAREQVLAHYTLVDMVRKTENLFLEIVKDVGKLVI